ncbi:hypothetical protein [Sphingopyxis macrogoltabida]|uniref:Uncharacterized protein n=2 Tax=Sphingopyxis macrogoltabida TaxID=33050 RepID=A0AAC9FGW3_SPHMC|nr:hypothetical protein [Sphingopyxis macrogoltabida]ALJ15747.1 hypothetical protein LH19_22970 [Sphingopyxis macrogoltabida]AMU91988.1 hypothetical protein ATM17_23530 [Sphingopyxis macrogoltabida]
MAGRTACRGCFARFGAAFAASCVIAMTMAGMAAAQVQGPPAPPRDAETAAANAKEMVDPIRRCKPADDGSITVCGTDTERHRLSPELRAIAGVGRDARPKLPRAEAQGMMFDRLPYNWVALGKGYPPGPEYNALYEMAKRATDPDTGTPVPEEAEP